ncbi:MAG: hypothetical protein HYT62_04075 [Candidatus Yanofskybacteria bacterium]|nr:hypothetical protein [Candidatus Yanofskybacteria bacterium]
MYVSDEQRRRWLKLTRLLKEAQKWLISLLLLLEVVLNYIFVITPKK